MSPDALRSLAHDITQNGQQQDIVLLDGLVLDGRNRVAACEIAGVTPRVTTLDSCDSPVAYIMRANITHRHFNRAQRAAIAVEGKVLLQAEAKTRRHTAGTVEPAKGVGPSPRAMVTAASIVAISLKTAYVMEDVKRKNPAVFAAVKDGRITSIAQASRMAAGLPEPTAHLAAAAARDEKLATFDEQVAKMLELGDDIKTICTTLGCARQAVQRARSRLGFARDRSVPSRALAHLEEFSDACATILRVAPWTRKDAHYRALVASAATKLKAAADAILKATSRTNEVTLCK